MDLTTSVIVVSLPALNPLLEYVLPPSWRVGSSPIRSLSRPSTKVEENRQRRLNVFTRQKPRDPSQSLGLSTLVTAGSDEETKDDPPSDLSNHEKEKGSKDIAVLNSWAVSEHQAEEGLPRPMESYPHSHPKD